MAEFLEVSSGSGSFVACDDIGGVLHQRIKLGLGPNGTFTADADGDATNGLDVDVTRVSPGTGASHLGKAEDAQHTSGDVGVMALAVRTDTPANKAADGDYEPLQLSAGRLWTSATVDAALPAGTNNIGDVDILSVVPGTAATSLGKAVDSPAGSTDTGVASLAVRDDALATLTPADGDYAPNRLNARGAKWVAIEDGAGGQITTFGGGTQYTEGDTDATITGTALMWEDTGNTLRPASAATPLPVTFGASEAHLGQMGGDSPQVEPATLTVTASGAYAVGDSIGAKLTIPNAVRVANGTSVWNSLLVTDLSNLKADFDVLLFRSDPSAATIVDNSGVSFTDPDWAKLTATLRVTASDYFTAGNRAVASIGGIGKNVFASGSTSLYCALVSTSAPNYSGAAHLGLKFGFLRD